MNLRNRKDIMITVGVSTAVICVVVLLFFRTSVFTGIFSKAVTILMPFIYGAVIAYLLHPLSDLLEKKLKLKRILAILLAVVIMFALVILLLVAVVPELVSSISDLLRGIPAMVAELEQTVSGILSQDSELMELINGSLNMTSESVISFLQSNVLPQLKGIMNNMSSGVGGMISVTKNFLLGTIIAVYLLGSWEKLGTQIKMIVYALFPHNAAEWLRKEAHFTDEKFSGFIFGKVVDSLIIGVLCFIFMLVARMPYAMLISLVVGVTNIIPFFGPYIGAIPSAILILTVSPVKCAIFVVFIILLQQLDGNVIGPKILGDKLGLSAFWILFSILVFGALWGIVGMLVGAPVFAVLYDIVRDFVMSSLKKKNETEILEEYQEMEAEKTKDRKE